jgi:hypothetical protein
MIELFFKQLISHVASSRIFYFMIVATTIFFYT